MANFAVNNGANGAEGGWKLSSERTSRLGFTVTISLVLIATLAAIAVTELHPAGKSVRLSSRLAHYRLSNSCNCTHQPLGVGKGGAAAAAAAAAALPDPPACPAAVACKQCAECPACPEPQQPEPCPEQQPCPAPDAAAATGSTQATAGTGGGKGGKAPSLPDPLAVLRASPWEPSLPEHELLKGLVSYGDMSRMRRFFTKLLSGQAVTVGERDWAAAAAAVGARQAAGSGNRCSPGLPEVLAYQLAQPPANPMPVHSPSLRPPACAVSIGGSVSWGHGASVRGQTDLPALVFQWMNATFPHPQHKFLNRAISGGARGQRACLQVAAAAGMKRSQAAPQPTCPLSPPLQPRPPITSRSASSGTCPLMLTWSW